jgi:predicted MPP superfamily phosphohydrolase
MSPIACLILALGAAGHVVLWVALVNRTHALGIRRRWIDLITVICAIMLAALPLLALAVLTGFIPSAVALWSSVMPRIVWTYLILCAAVLMVAVFQRLSWSRNPARNGSVSHNHTTVIQLADPHNSLFPPGIPSWLGNLPRNEVLNLSIEEKTIAIPRMQSSSEPLRIVHLTDFHMSGRIKRRYFERVVEETNALNPDIVAITGDIVEREPCIEWIPETLGRLKASSGVYYVLGNHDLHVNIERLNAALVSAGLVHLGAECCQISIRGVPIILGGNELPWFKHASNFNKVPGHDESRPLRILLSHSPDEFKWAQANDVDLMLAGHLHGGQVRLPLFGAILSPSRYGVRYALGVFMVGNTVMHVSRGTGSLTPLRYNCAPEIAVLTLRGPNAI